MHHQGFTGIAHANPLGFCINDNIHRHRKICTLVKTVPGIEEAISHINRYNTGHSEAIITNDYHNSQKFLDEVDAAAVYKSDEPFFYKCAEHESPSIYCVFEAFHQKFILCVAPLFHIEFIFQDPAPARSLGAQKLYISAHPAQETQAFYHALGCVEAEEYHKELAESEPDECQLEYAL